jgi:phosphoglycolate phosphatase
VVKVPWLATLDSHTAHSSELAIRAPARWPSLPGPSNAYARGVTNESLLVLWDVDGTLIHNGGVSKRAYALGFEFLAGRPPAVKVMTDGMTDVAIMRSLFERQELSTDLAERIPAAMERALASLVLQLRVLGHAMPGAREVIEALAKRGIVQSVLSGNVAPNAFAKVAAFDLHFGLDFEVGGFGSDHEVRAMLVDVPRARAAAKYDRVFSRESTVLIGDTPRDVEAGRDGGARVIAVASGAFSVEELSAAGADVVLADLRDVDRVVEAVIS